MDRFRNLLICILISKPFGENVKIWSKSFQKNYLPGHNSTQKNKFQLTLCYTCPMRTIFPYACPYHVHYIDFHIHGIRIFYIFITCTDYINIVWEIIYFIFDIISIIKMLCISVCIYFSKKEWTNFVTYSFVS